MGTAEKAQWQFYSHMRDNVWNDETLSNSEKVEIMKQSLQNMLPEQLKNFNVVGNPDVIQNSDYSDWSKEWNYQYGGAGYWPKIDWPPFPGLDGKTAYSVVDVTTGEINIPENVDRIGSPWGNNVSIVQNGEHYTQEDRTTPYFENSYARNDYSFAKITYVDVINTIKDFDINNPQPTVEKLNEIIDTNNALTGQNKAHFDASNIRDVAAINEMKDSYNHFQGNCVDFCKEFKVDSTYGLIGKATEWKKGDDVLYPGGAEQINTPISIASLERLGIVKNEGGWD